MSLYFLKEETTPPAVENAGTQERRHPLARILLASVVILVAAGVQASGLLLPQEIRLLRLLGIAFPPPSPTILLTLATGENGHPDPMEAALALRGLSMLHPALILHATGIAPATESNQLLEGLKEQVRERGIPLIEAKVAKDPAETVTYRPVPLCRYRTPGQTEGKDRLPVVSGSAPPEGTARYFPGEATRPGFLPLLFRTTTREIAGSLWWDALLQGSPNAPVWLVADRFLILPNHTVLLFTEGGTAATETTEGFHPVPLDDFLLRIEEKERGSLSPGFDALWDGAVVVIGPSSLEPAVRSLTGLRALASRGALSLTNQLILSVLLVALAATALSLIRRPAVGVALLILLGGAAAGWWCLHQGILPPILPWIAALAGATAGVLWPSRRRR